MRDWTDRGGNRGRGALALLLLVAAVSALCLPGCGKSGEDSYRDPDVEAPQVQSVSRAEGSSRPAGGCHYLNIRRDGSVWIARDHPATEAEVDSLIAQVLGKGVGHSLVLRGDSRVAWKHVAPAVVRMKKAGVRQLSFSVEQGDGGEAFLDYSFRAPSQVPELRVEFGIAIQSTEEKGSGGPRLLIGQRAMRDWDQACQTLTRLSQVPGAQYDPVVLDSDGEARLGDVLCVLAALRERGFRDIAFREALDVPDAAERVAGAPTSPREGKAPAAAAPAPEQGVSQGAEPPMPPLARPATLPAAPAAVATIEPAHLPRDFEVVAQRPPRIGSAGGASRIAESAVMAGLIWLAKAQDKDGHWDCKFWDGAGDYSVGVTGLSLLAFLGAGYTHKKGKFKEIVSRGLAWLRAGQKPNGSFGWRTFYEQGIATLAVCEAFGMTRDPDVREMAQSAANFIVATQPEHGGFRYGGAVPKDEGDLCVTGWQILALRSAQSAELTVPPHAFERARLFLKSTCREYGMSAYLAGNKQPGGPALWAIEMFCRQTLGAPLGDPEVQAAANALLQHAKRLEGDERKGKDRLVSDLYYTYFSTAAMYQMGGEWWAVWNKMLRDPLVRAQETKRILDERGRFIRGSWDPANDAWGAQGGRVCSTAFAVLSLEVYYRFLPLYKK